MPIKAHRDGDARVCGASTVVTGQSTVFVNGKLWAVDNDPNSHGGGELAPVDAGVYVEGKPVVVHRPDTAAIDARNDVLETKLDEALEYSRDIKNGLRDDIVRIERIVDKVEDDINNVEDDVRTTIDDAEERFEVKRQDLLNQYVAQKDLLIRENTATRDILETKIQNLESDMEKQLQRALDNPLANR